MAGRKEHTVKAARGWLGTLMVAWTFVSGSALVFATAYYHRTHDLEALIVWLAPPFLVGFVLLGTILLVTLFGSVKEQEVEVALHKGTRESLWRR